MKKIFLLLSFILSLTAASAQKKPMKEFIDDLMAKMTVEEKIGQLNLMPGTDLTTGAKTNSPLVVLSRKDSSEPCSTRKEPRRSELCKRSR